MSEHTDAPKGESAPGGKYRTLPERVAPEDMVEEHPAEAPHDPDGGRDPERDFMIRYSG